jgi:signal transduction histidine kinase
MSQSMRAHSVSGPNSEGASRGLFEFARKLSRWHPLATDSIVTLLLILVSTGWLWRFPSATVSATLLQIALLAPLIVRRVRPTEVFLLMSAFALIQWLLGYQLIGDVGLLIALYSVAAHEERRHAIACSVILEAGSIMASVKWDPAGTVTRSVFFLSALVIGGLFAGLTVASGSSYLSWLDERTRKLEQERDQQAVIAANAERTRIARELHDIVSHSLSVVITLADAAAVVNRSDPNAGADAMVEVSEVGRHALSDMRSMLGVLRDDADADGHAGNLAPQPTLDQIGVLIERVKATGLDVALEIEGEAFSVEAALELTVYRIVQESLTNTVRHATAGHAWVTISYNYPELKIRVVDDGTTVLRRPSPDGRGIEGMRERAALHGGTLDAGRVDGLGWSVATTLSAGATLAHSRAPA